MKEQESANLNIGRYILSLKRNWLLLFTIFVSSTTLGLAGSTLIKPSYEAEGKLLFKLSNFKTVGSSITTSGREGEETGTLGSIISNQNPINTEIEVMYSANMLEKIITQLNLRDTQGKMLKPEDIRRTLKIKIVQNTDVVNIIYNSKKPEESAEVINKLMQVYIENDLFDNRTEVLKNYDFLAKKLPFAEKSVKEAETALRDFKQKNSVVDLTEESKAIAGIIANLDNQINETESSLFAINSQIKALQTQINPNSQEVLANFNISKATDVQNILSQLQEIDRQLAIERDRFSEINPNVTSLQSKRSNLNSLLQKEMQELIGIKNNMPVPILQISNLQQQLIKDLLQTETQRATLAQKLTSLSNYRQNYTKRAALIPQLLENQGELEQKLAFSRSSYNNLLTKLQELQIAANKSTANAWIIAQAAIPEKPQITKKLLVIAAGVVLGLVLSTTTCIIIAITDTTLRTVKEIKEIFKTTLLGVIPEIPENSSPLQTVQDLVNKNDVDSLISENYNIIQTNLRFLRADHRIKTIVITSCISGEGKSTAASNLAISLAKIEKKVLLIDADLHLSSQHHFWNIPNDQGLSDVLVCEIEFDDAVSIITDNLHILTAGRKTPDNFGLIDSKRMIELMAEFKDNYDFVIVDSPSLLISVEAISLGQHSDGIVLVSKPGLLDYTSISATKEIFSQSHQNLLGVIVNGMLPDDQTNKYLFPAQEYFTEREKYNYLKRVDIKKNPQEKSIT
jgi:capsular exopolysaccharide synthesis family protein